MPTSGADRKRLLNSMSREERATYQAELKTYTELCTERSAHIKQHMDVWLEADGPWPYELIEDYDDEEMCGVPDEDVCVSEPNFSMDLNKCTGQIKFDLSLLSMI